MVQRRAHPVEKKIDPIHLRFGVLARFGNPSLPS
jgi:hypothetical protein